MKFRNHHLKTFPFNQEVMANSKKTKKIQKKIEWRNLKSAFYLNHRDLTFKKITTNFFKWKFIKIEDVWNNTDETILKTQLWINFTNN